VQPVGAIRLVRREERNLELDLVTRGQRVPDRDPEGGGDLGQDGDPQAATSS
jgi:hypothetical protein